MPLSCAVHVRLLENGRELGLRFRVWQLRYRRRGYVRYPQKGKEPSAGRKRMATRISGYNRGYSWHRECCTSRRWQAVPVDDERPILALISRSHGRIRRVLGVIDCRDGSGLSRCCFYTAVCFVTLFRWRRLLGESWWLHTMVGVREKEYQEEVGGLGAVKNSISL